MKWLDSMLDVIFGKDIVRVLVIDGFNWKGNLPEKVDWDWASKLGFAAGPPERTTCPECDKKLVHAKHDYALFMDCGTGERAGGQYMVHTYSCPDGHGSIVDWA